MKSSFIKFIAALSLLPSLALAHTGHADASGFMHGFGHPLGGLDHMLAMIAVGLWAAQMGGRALWAVPTTFVSVMILGGVLGFTGVALPFVEAGILASILVIGLMVAGAFKVSSLHSSLLVAVFALFHGFAHGAEMPAAISGLTYAVGFAVATALLHIAGMATGVTAKKVNLNLVSRIAGAVITLCGVYLAVA